MPEPAMVSGPRRTSSGLPILNSEWQPYEVDLLRRAVVDAKLHRYATLTSQPPAVVAAALGNNEGRIMSLDVRVDWDAIAEKYLPSRGGPACHDYWRIRFEERTGPPPPPGNFEIRRDLRESAPRTPQELKAEFMRERDSSEYIDRAAYPQHHRHPQPRGAPGIPQSRTYTNTSPRTHPQYNFRSEAILDRRPHSAISDTQYGASTASIIDNLRVRGVSRDGPLASEETAAMSSQIDVLTQRMNEMEENHRRAMEVQRTMIDNLEREFWKIRKQMSDLTDPGGSMPTSPAALRSGHAVTPTNPQGPGTPLRGHGSFLHMGAPPPR